MELPAGRLRDVVQSRMWRWLFDAHRLLGSHLEIIDETRTLVTAPSSASGALRNAVAADHDVGRFLTLDTPQLTVLAGLRVACTPIVVANVVVGAVLIGVTAAEHVDDAALARAGGVLAKAIEDQLSRTTDEQRASVRKISALYQLLHAGIAMGSEAAVLRTFAEALSIWEDIEIFAYRADLQMRYQLEVSLPGSCPDAAAPTRVHGSVDPLTAASPAHDAVNGVAGVEGDTPPIHLSTEGGAWLITLRATSGAVRVELSDLYFAALGHALNAAVAVEASRLTWALMQHFVSGDSPSQAAERATMEIAAALNAEGRFVVLRPNGAAMVAAGARGNSIADSAARIDGATLRARVEAPSPFVAVLEMRAVNDHVFTERDVKLFQSACATFDRWLPPLLRQARATAERRGGAATFDDLLERHAREAYASRDAASLILIGGGEGGASPEATQAWIRRLRPELRPTDLSGRLRTGEVGILLLRTPVDGAQVVARRLVAMLQRSAVGPEPAVRVGVASQIETVISAEALIEEARRQPVDGGGVTG